MPGLIPLHAARPVLLLKMKAKEMAIQEANPKNLGTVTIVYADNIGGQRAGRFNHGYELAAHVQRNRPALYTGIPKEDDHRAHELRIQREEGWCMDWEHRYKARNKGHRG